MPTFRLRPAAGTRPQAVSKVGPGRSPRASLRNDAAFTASARVARWLKTASKPGVDVRPGFSSLLTAKKRLKRLPGPMEIAMPEDEVAAQTERMLDAAFGGLTPHQVLLRASQAENADVAGRAAAIAKNRERALRLLAEIEKSQA